MFKIVYNEVSIIQKHGNKEHLEQAKKDVILMAPPSINESQREGIESD
jgi:hypothetical protein